MIRDCPSYPGYSITDKGTVYTHRRRCGNGMGYGCRVVIDAHFRKKMNRYIGHGGYWYVSISTKQGQRSVPIHTLLADAFICPRPRGLQVRHLDGNPLNLKLSNIIYGTPYENILDKIRCGNHLYGEKHPRAKLTEAQVREIRMLAATSYRGNAAIARKFSITKSAVWNIVNRYLWKHI